MVERNGTGTGSPLRLLGFELAVVGPTIAWLLLFVIRRPNEVLRPSTLVRAAAIAVVDLMPVPAAGGLRLTLSFPILLAVGMVSTPSVAATVGFARIV